MVVRSWDSILALGTAYICGTDGRRARRNIGDIAAASEHAVERILHDRHGIESNDTGIHVHEILNARSSELGSERIDECDMSGPAGTAVANISAAFAALGYHLGIVGDILGRGVMDVIERHAQILADRAVEILELRIGEAALIGGGGDISVVVRPLIHCEHINVAAADIVEVDDLGDGAVNNGARLGRIITHFLSSISDAWMRATISPIQMAPGLSTTWILKSGFG